jgi:hypothetical protein
MEIIPSYNDRNQSTHINVSDPIIYIEKDSSKLKD